MNDADTSVNKECHTVPVHGESMIDPLFSKSRILIHHWTMDNNFVTILSLLLQTSYQNQKFVMIIHWTVDNSLWQLVWYLSLSLERCCCYGFCRDDEDDDVDGDLRMMIMLMMMMMMMMTMMLVVVVVMMMMMMMISMMMNIEMLLIFSLSLFDGC